MELLNKFGLNNAPGAADTDGEGRCMDHHMATATGPVDLS